MEKWWARESSCSCRISLWGSYIIIESREARAERDEQERHEEVYLIRVAMAGAGEVERTDYTPKSSFADDLQVLKAMWFGSVSGDSHQDQLESFYNKQVRTRPRPPAERPASRSKRPRTPRLRRSSGLTFPSTPNSLFVFDCLGFRVRLPLVSSFSSFVSRQFRIPHRAFRPTCTTSTGIGCCTAGSL